MKVVYKPPGVRKNGLVTQRPQYCYKRDLYNAGCRQVSNIIIFKKETNYINSLEVQEVWLER